MIDYMITVADVGEGELIARGLELPEVRAFVKIVAALKVLPSDRARARVLRYFADKAEEDRIAAAILPDEDDA